ncbi:MAG TPA: hypothetical protein VF614_06130 [Chthoniobacteraceae bacterium]
MKPHLLFLSSLAASAALTFSSCDQKKPTTAGPGTQQQAAGSHGNGHESTGTNSAGGTDNASK